MNLALIVLGLIGSVKFALAQNVPGLTLNAPGPLVKMEGFTLQRMQGGYVTAAAHSCGDLDAALFNACCRFRYGLCLIVFDGPTPSRGVDRT